MDPFLNTSCNYSTNVFNTDFHHEYNDVVTVDELDNLLAENVVLNKPLVYLPSLSLTTDAEIDTRVSIFDTSIRPIIATLPPNKLNIGGVYTVVLKIHKYPLVIKPSENDTIYKDQTSITLSNELQHINFLSIGDGIWIIV